MSRISIAVIIVIILSTVSSGNCMKNDLKTKILKFLKLYERPNLMAAYVCWNKVDRVNFVKLLNRDAGIAVTLLEATASELWTPDPDYAHHAIFLADMACRGTVDLLLEADKRMLLKAPYRWLIINQESSMETVFTGSQDGYTESGNVTISESLAASSLEKNFTGIVSCKSDTNISKKYTVSAIFNYLGIFPDSDINVIIDSNENDMLDYVSVYRSWCGSELHAEKIAGTSLASYRRDLNGAPLKICYVITDNDTINHLSDYWNRQVDTITKVNFILTNHLMDFLNASRSFSFVNSWGYKTDDGEWSGMIGELHTKNADIGGSPLFFTADRVSVIDYIAMPSPTRSKFVFRQPKLSYMSNVFALPFRKDVWECSAALIVILIIALFISTKWEWSAPAYQKDSDNDSETLRPSWSDVSLMTIGSVCQQGSSVQLKGPVGRIVILMSFMSLMFLYTSYSANIVALLQSSSSRIKTLSDLLNSRLKLAAHDTVFNHYYFKTATEPVRKAIYQKKIAPPGSTPRFITLDEGVRKLREGLFAFHMEIGVGYKVVSEIFREEEKCGLQEIQYLQVVDPWLAVQKNSSYKEMFKIGFRRIQEYGLQARENWLLYTKKPHCSGTGSIFVSVGIVDCEPAMMVLAYGGIIAILLLIIENLLAYRLKLTQCLTTTKKSSKIKSNE